MASNISHLRTHRGQAPEGRLAPLSRRQHGLFTARQAMQAGLSRSQIRYRIKRGHWEVVDFGVFKVSGTVERWEQKLLAACLAGPAVASHRAAARLWSLPRFADAPTEVTAFRHRRRRRTTAIWHESFHLSGRDVTVVDGLPVTSVHRTIIDLAVVCPPEDVERALDAAIHRGLTNDFQVRKRLERFGRRRGANALLRLLDGRTPGTAAPESVLETTFVQLVRGAGLPMPAVQHQVSAGDFRARIDFAYPDRRIAIEVDGAASHTSRHDRQRDQRRQNRLVLLGWQVLRFTWDDLMGSGDEVVRDVRHALAGSP